MAYFDSVFKPLAVIALIVLVACGDFQRAQDDPETRHCERAAQRLVREVGAIRILESMAWTIEDVRNVRVRFEYPEENPEGLSVGNVLCSYAFPVELRGDDKRYPQARSVYFHGRHLSENELLLLNMALRGTRPELKVR